MSVPKPTPFSPPSPTHKPRQSFSSSIRPPVIPNIPPRSSNATPSNAFSSSPKYGASFSSSFKTGGHSLGKSLHKSFGEREKAALSAKGSQESILPLGEKKDLSSSIPGVGGGSSTLAAALAANSPSSSHGSGGQMHSEPPTPAEPLVEERGRSHKPHPHSISASASPLPPNPFLSRADSSGLLASLSRQTDGSDPTKESDLLSPSSLSDIPDSAKAEVIRRHLVSAQERQAGEAERRGSMHPASGPPSRGGYDSAGSSGVILGSDDEHTQVQGKGKEADRSRSRSAEKVGSRSGSKARGNGHKLDGELEGWLEGSGPPSAGGEGEDHFPLPYDAQGGDITHGIYKWQQSHLPGASHPGHNKRSLSLSAVPRAHRADSEFDELDPALKHMNEPNGFRRVFVSQRAEERGEEGPKVLGSFFDFLFLYGHFAGEDLDEDSYESDSDILPTSAAAATAASTLTRRVLSRGASALPGHMIDERQPLLQRSLSRTRRRAPGAHGDATVWQAILMLLKGFVGTGVLFLGKAFFNGGILFSSIVLLTIAAISLWSFLLLVKTRLVVPGSFGDIGGAMYGPQMRTTILTSIALSQVGFVAAYTIFVAENMQAFILAVTDCRTKVSVSVLIFAQLVIFLPLSMIRNLAALSSTALIADAFILVGLIYIGTNEVTVIAQQGIADVALFNKKDFSLLIGTAVFAFEGIGLIIPITESMQDPQKFPKVLSAVMGVVATLFVTFGFLGYAAYGDDIQTVVIVNLPQEQKFVQVVQCLYSIAILLSAPLQLFPAVRIMENGLFSKSGKHNPQVKWQKNIFRAGTVLLCSMISWLGSSNLDGFVSIIGSFACVPLCFIYPPLLHLKARAKTRTEKTLDYLLIIFGVVTAVYTTIQTGISLMHPAAGSGGKFGKCDA